MKSYIKNIMAVGLSAIVVAGAIVPAEAAMPLPTAPKSVETAGNDASNNVVNVQYWRDRGGRDGWGDRRGWYGGHRGYRDYRPGYRHHDGYWFPLAAFATGAIIGGALSQPREVYRPVPEYRPRPVYREGTISGYGYGYNRPYRAHRYYHRHHHSYYQGQRVLRRYY